MKIEYFILSKQKIILQIKRSKEDKINIDNKEKLLKSFTELYKRSPKGEEMYNNINIGQIWRNIKNCKSNLYEDILSKNIILKAAYDTFTKGKEETKNTFLLCYNFTCVFNSFFLSFFIKYIFLKYFN